MKKPGPGGHTHKHRGSTKHGHVAGNKGPGPVKHHPRHKPVPVPVLGFGTGKHQPPPPPQHHHHHHHHKRKMALANEVACCSAEALAASLRLTGQPVTDADVLALYEHTADDADMGASLLETLQAAAMFGLAGVKPVSYSPVLTAQPGDLRGLVLTGGRHSVAVDTTGLWSWGEFWDWDRWDFGCRTEETWTVRWPS